MDKQVGFVYPGPDEEIYYTTTFPDGKEKTVYYYPNEENEYCDIIFIDELVKKNQELMKKQKCYLMKKQREIFVKNIKNVKHKLKFVKPSVFKSNIVFYSTLNFKDRDYPEFDYIRIVKNQIVRWPYTKI